MAYAVQLLKGDFAGGSSDTTRKLEEQTNSQ